MWNGAHVCSLIGSKHACSHEHIILSKLLFLVFIRGSTANEWLAQQPRSSEVIGLDPGCGVCTFFPWLRGFPPGTPVSIVPKHRRSINCRLQIIRYCEWEWLFPYLCPVIDWRSVPCAPCLTLATPPTPPSSSQKAQFQCICMECRLYAGFCFLQTAPVIIPH